MAILSTEGKALTETLESQGVRAGRKYLSASKILYRRKLRLRKGW